MQKLYDRASEPENIIFVKDKTSISLEILTKRTQSATCIIVAALVWFLYLNSLWAAIARIPVCSTTTEYLSDV